MIERYSFSAVVGSGGTARYRSFRLRLSSAEADRQERPPLRLRLVMGERSAPKALILLSASADDHDRREPSRVQEERGTVLKRVFLEYAVLHTRNSKVRTPPKKWRGSLIV